jgi:hypothetical protein
MLEKKFNCKCDSCKPGETGNYCNDKHLHSAVSESVKGKSTLTNIYLIIVKFKLLAAISNRPEWRSHPAASHLTRRTSRSMQRSNAHLVCTSASKCLAARLIVGKTLVSD